MITLNNWQKINKDKVDWYAISKHQKLSEEFIREFSSRLNWFNISWYQKLSENFIREFKDKVYWYYISKHQQLSEDFIREFKDKVNWEYIRMYQKLSKDFIEEFNIDYKVANVIHYCGNFNRPIYILKNSPDLIHIGCFKGTKKEAIRAIESQYTGESRVNYIDKVNECFLITREQND